MTEHDAPSRISSEDWTAFVKQEGGPMYRHALTRTRTPEVAEEIVHDVFCSLRVWVSRIEAEGEPVRSLRAMGWSILRNRLIDENKRAYNRDHHSIDRAGGQPDPGCSTVCGGQRSARYEMEVRRAYDVAVGRIDLLPPQLRDAFMAVVKDRRVTQQQYADAHGISQAKVSRMIARAKALLRANLTLPGAPTFDGVSPLQRQYRTVE